MLKSENSKTDVELIREVKNSGLGYQMTRPARLAHACSQRKLYQCTGREDDIKNFAYIVKNFTSPIPTFYSGSARYPERRSHLER